MVLTTRPTPAYGRIPAGIIKIDGCDCKTTGYSDVHLVTCSIHMLDLDEAEFDRRHAAAYGQALAWARGE